MILSGIIFLGLCLVIIAHLTNTQWNQILLDIESRKTQRIHSRLSTEFIFLKPLIFRRVLRSVLGLGVISTLLFSSLEPLMISCFAVIFCPHIALSLLSRRRRRKFLAQLPQALHSISSLLKSGHTFERSLESLAQTLPPPFGQECQLIVRELRLGSSLLKSFQNLAHRIPSPELNIVIRSMEVSKRTGSNLAESLDQVSEMVKQRTVLKDRILALTAQGRAQGWIACALPLVMIITLETIAPGYLQPLWDSDIGRLLLGISAIALIIGVTWIQVISRRCRVHP